MNPISGEAEARAWLTGALAVSRETMRALEIYAELLRVANVSQNLIAASTAGDQFWVRHIVDSAQLILHALDAPGDWIDLGSGPGLPGLIVAIMEPDRRVILVESRRLRCAFLRECCSALDLTERVVVAEMSVARVSAGPHAVISARAFAPLPRLLLEATHLAGPQTRWLLPKGQNAVKELSTLAPAWQKRFHVERSLTDANAAILVGNGLPSAAHRTPSKGKARR